MILDPVPGFEIINLFCFPTLYTGVLQPYRLQPGHRVRQDRELIIRNWSSRWQLRMTGSVLAI